MDLHFQSLKDSYHTDLEQFDERRVAYIDNHYQIMRSFVQNTHEAQNAKFCAEFEKLRFLIRGDSSLTAPDDRDPPRHP
ncbi:hypothetical protein TanjilG_19939 [Lupinus angustifolius]|uniref:Uncharacterized protein n=1 Tax=Lupinus angustifolius TaxID=3871 RepID=A0A1J7H0Z4_LUPAN|nr:hypothetical protein TanjilG_19939 [Lupinus angustifolius]